MKKSILFLALAPLLSYSTSVLATGDINITIHKNMDKTGLELGENSRARGTGSIATGRNSIAMGKNAVATGGNETQETILRKLAENKAKLDEITSQENTIARISDEIEALKIREHETIEAGIRVQEIRKAKEKAKLEYQRLQKIHDDEVSSSAQFFADAQAKIDDLNSRLDGISRLSGYDIHNDTSLNQMVAEFKQQVENGTTLNLTQDFYKKYIESYYRTLGTLTENKNRVLKFVSGYFNYNSLTLRDKNKAFKKLEHVWYSDDFQRGFFRGIFSETEYHKSFTSDLPKPEENIEVFELDTITVSKERYEQVKRDIPKYKALIQEYFKTSNDIFSTDKVTLEKMEKTFDTKLNYLEKVYEVGYYQNEYNKTKDISWLDKKKKAMDEAKIIKDTGEVYNLSILREKNWEKFKQEKVIAVEEANKITTEHLTHELEQALGINKNAIATKKAEIAKMLADAEQAKNNWEGINPSEKDLLLAKEYERVAKILLEKGNLLKTASERLKYLKDNLTLNDLTNVGADSIAYGTDNLATGNASIALGKSNVSTKENATAIGQTNLVDSKNSQAIGVGNNLLSANTTSENQATLGNANTLVGTNNYVVGSNNSVGTQNSPKNNIFILGSNINASNASDAIILGNQSAAVSGAVSVGRAGAERKIVNVKNGDVSQNSKEAVNGSQLHSLRTELLNARPGSSNNKLDVDMSNLGTLTTSAKTKLQQKLSENANLDNPTGALVTDTQVKAKLGRITSDLANAYLKVDGSNISSTTSSFITNLISKLNENASLDNPTGALVTDTQVKAKLDQKADKTALSNKLEAKNIHRITSDTLGVTNEGNLVKGDVKLSIKPSSITKTMLGSDVNTEISSLAKKDASNLDIANINAWKKKLGIKGTSIPHSDSSKLNVDMSNLGTLTTSAKTKLQQKLSENANLDNPTGALVTDTQVKAKLDQKADISTVTNLTKKVDDNTVKVTTLTNKVNDNTAKVTNLTNKVSSNTTKIAKNAEEINALKNNAKKDTTLTQGDNIKLSHKTNATGGKEYKVSVAKNVKVDSVTTGSVKVSKNGINAGGHKVTNVQAGEISKTSTDAINGKQAEELRSRIIQNAKNIKLLDGYVSDVRRFDSRITNIEKNVEKLDKKRKAGTAAALATAGLMQPMRAGQSGVTAAIGQYQSQTAIAVGYSKISNNGKYGVKISLNANTQSEVGGTVGVGYFW
ncbi:YadA-like family protein [Phocoenobacter skyensis]|uniref:YadA-like family protein n=1 Tax=Phocoenobacter skyensis TaxID=97481 RepID=UPI0027755051|nr:YadA-like family protein [Pasteurella skyensis]MDP8185287.1 YadA-like family protein [Pasteurella skyensis]